MCKHSVFSKGWAELTGLRFVPDFKNLSLGEVGDLNVAEYPMLTVYLLL
ncbi:MAG TPA: hypothetical protein VEP89_12250 [Draconibacterium sp.]|nr:hypothetical protein [Draconibacterium sp.]